VNTAERQLLADGAAQLGIRLDDLSLNRFATLAGELRRWNARVNLTALTATREVIARHFLDSLTVAPLVPAGARLLDLGSGGGFPSLPLAIARPDLSIVSLDATLKKIHFQRHAVRILGLDRFQAIHGRAEQLAAAMPANFAVVVARAVTGIATLVRLGLPLLATGGRVIAMRGPQGIAEAAAAHELLAASGMAVVETREVRLPVSGEGRVLVVIAAAIAGNEFQGP
jgi:16S rRNA (guanine527-N7)-methyltransferase